MGPWLCGGDFNQILYHGEKLGGPMRDQNLLDDFKSALDDCELNDLGYIGMEYTWWNGQEGDSGVHERLDRMVANKKWLDIFPLFYVYHLNKGSLD